MSDPRRPLAADPYDRAASASTADSARSLLLSVLGTFVLPEGGSAWTGSLLSALALGGVGDGTARQALSRAGQRGLVVSERHGRRARWHLSDRATGVLSSGAERLYGFGPDRRPWDQRWLLLLASVPEAQRDRRYRLKVQLGWAGFGQLGPGLWISPWTEREGEARAALAVAGPDLAARSFVAQHGQIGDPRSVVADAWDLSSLAGEYEAFLHRFEPVAPDSPADAARWLLVMTHHWRWFPAHDPGLPAELLPEAWPGRAAAALFDQRRQDWTPAAHQWWLEQEGTG